MRPILQQEGETYIAQCMVHEKIVGCVGSKRTGRDFGSGHATILARLARGMRLDANTVTFQAHQVDNQMRVTEVTNHRTKHADRS